MNFNGKKLVGILGGMGPDAMVNFLAKITAKTPATKDQDHIPMVIFSYPQIPDRTKSILSGKNDVLRYLKEGIRFLLASKVNLIAIPCVSSHFYYDSLVKISGVPILSIIEETTKTLTRQHPDVKTVGILGTTMTVQKGLFVSSLKKLRINAIVPGKVVQGKNVMGAIYLVKGGNQQLARETIGPAVAELVSKNVGAIIAGCTEIPLILDSSFASVPVLDTLECLSEAVVREAM
jgi:aspartate racemase